MASRNHLAFWTSGVLVAASISSNFCLSVFCLWVSEDGILDGGEGLRDEVLEGCLRNGDDACECEDDALRKAAEPPPRGVSTSGVVATEDVRLGVVPPRGDAENSGVSQPRGVSAASDLRLGEISLGEFEADLGAKPLRGVVTGLCDVSMLLGVDMPSILRAACVLKEDDFPLGVMPLPLGDAFCSSAVDSANCLAKDAAARSFERSGGTTLAAVDGV